MTEPTPSDLSANTPLGRALAERYTVLRELGSGGMATVFLAEDLRHRRKVAIKVLHPELSAVIGSERFLKEIELTANLQHPHILPLFDSGDVNGQLYYVMPFVDGETLRSRLDREQQLPVGDAVRIAREVADALAYAHKRGVVHRDIKPENVLLQDGHALVADFGIALAVQQAGAGRLTQTGLSLGTPQYMSPEQAMGERTIDLRADIYALGAVTYEMLAGEPPFTGPTAQAIIARAMTERPRSLSGVRETLPPAVNNAVMTALAKLPADRFSSASEFAEALVREGSAIHPTVEGELPPRDALRRSWLPWAMLAAGLVIGAGIAALRWRTGTRGADTSDPRFLSIALPDSAPFVGQHDPYDIPVRSLDISSDGRLVVWSTGRDSVPSIWQMRTDLGTVGPIAGTTKGIIPTLSPDGNVLAFLANGDVRRLELATGATSTVGRLPVAEALFWQAPDRIFANDYQGYITTPNASGTFSPYPAKGSALASGGASPGPDQNHLLVSARGSLGVYDLRDGRVQYIRRAGASDTTDLGALIAGDTPLLMGAETVLFMRDSSVYAARVDFKALRLTTAAVQMLSGVRHEASAGAGGVAQIALSASGMLAWVSGSDASAARFVLVTPNGATDTLPLPAENVNSYALTRDGNRVAYSITRPGNTSVIRIFDRRRNLLDSVSVPIDVAIGNWVDGETALSVVIPNAKPKGRHYAVLRGLGGKAALDSTGVQYYASSPDGRTRCSANGIFFPAASAGDSVRFDQKGNWCRFSPDGTNISWDDQGSGLMVTTADANAASARQRIAPMGANEARWSRDGRELIYRNGSRWFAVPAHPAADGTLTPPRLVLKGAYNQAWASWDLAPDGRFLLLQGAPPARANHLNVITNFPRYVEAKLKATGH